MLLLATVVLALSAPLAADQPYAGRPVTEVLRELQTPELKIIFSTDLVRPEMRVQAEPKGGSATAIALEILAPHGLTLEPGPRGTMLVVTQRNKGTPAPVQRKPAAPKPPPPTPDEPAKPPEPLHIEEEVNVVDQLGRSRDVPSTYTLQPTAVREMAGAFENVFLAMHLLPGVVGTNDEDGKLAVRGAGPEHNLVSFDGVTIHNPLRFGDFTSNFLNPATAADVSLDASGLEARHGGRLSSVTSFESRDGNRSRRFGVSGSVGLTTGDVLAEGRLPGTASGSWWAAVRGTYYRAVMDRFGDGAIPGFGDVQGKVSLQPGKRTRLSIFALAGRETMRGYDLNGAGERYLRDEMKGVNRLGIVNLTWNPNSRLVTTTTPSIYLHDERQMDAERIVGVPTFERVMRVHDFAVRQRALYAFTPRHVLDGGVELHRIDSGWRMKNAKIPDFWRGLGPTTLGEQISYSAGPIDTSLTRTHVGLWLQDRLPLATRLTLEPGVRLDWNSFTGEGSLQPRLRATLRAAGTTIWAGFATQAQTPSHESLQGLDYFHITPAYGAHLHNERSRQIVAGVERGIGAGLDVRVEAYYRKFDRLLVQRLENDDEHAARLALYQIPPDIPPDDVTIERRPTMYPESTGEGEAKGIETLLQRRAGRLTGWLSYTYSYSTRDLYGYTVPFDYDRPHAATAVCSYQLSRRFRLSGTWRGASGLPVTPMRAEVSFFRLTSPDGTTDPFYRTFRNSDGTLSMFPGFRMRRSSLRNSERLGGYERTDVRLTYSTLGHWEFYGEVINLFNRRNFVERVKLDDPRISGGPVETHNNIYSEFERMATFGIRVVF
jgi:TonB dependent receptor-like, beta-barrel